MSDHAQIVPLSQLAIASWLATFSPCIYIIYTGGTVSTPTVGGAGSVTITQVTMSTTQLHTKTTTIGSPQPVYNQSAVGGAFPGEGGATGGMDVPEQGPSGTSAVNQSQQPPIRYREYYCMFTIANSTTIPRFLC